MFTYLTEHMRREGAMLEEYVAIAEGTESKALEYLVNLLVEDEHRHHRFFSELASSLKSEAETQRSRTRDTSTRSETRRQS